MTEPSTTTQPSPQTRPSFLQEAKANLTRVPVPYHEPPAVVLRRRIAVAVVVVIGAAVLGYSLSRPPGDSSFYGLTFALAGVWVLGALASRPLHLGHVRFFGRNQRPVITGTLIGLALGGAFVVGGLAAREIPALRDYAADVLEFANHGSLPLVALITVINGLAEELFFRGALYSALEKHHPAIISTIVYIIVIGVSTLNPMLTFAALVLGAVCAFERRATGGVLAPILTHMVWGLIMVLVLPGLFGV
ncbi:CPBP family intramembrane glutamic endopeptidase [Mycobacterium sp. 1274761.0]|uniref:CPBP family intramembrane glutamic endopeptidase n=1 Tax=Mycobacterium sp. 1274761.0 TaxID=1834077 RepID=UPI0007FFCD0F|nr:CPBP family intramembrane glutamic endopeptidase [Mycobacterium sp. 1274761.0]OBK73842.1 abortive infection protein [Mycobacterium sp. 1274761.0]